MVVEGLANQTGLTVSDIALDLRLNEDLGLDSLDAVELLIVLEEETGMILGLDSGIKSLRTVNDLVDWLATSAHPAPA